MNPNMLLGSSFSLAVTFDTYTESKFNSYSEFHRHFQELAVPQL